MDGLSAAAGGMAVVSLAIQLVGSVREIRQFFRTLEDAPEELGRLLDLLVDMELMLENIGRLVDPDSDISPSVLKAIQTCEKALNKLLVLIQKVRRNASAQSPLKRSLGFFRLACKKQEVEEIEKQLDRAVSNLNMVITVLNFKGIQRIWSGVSAVKAATATIPEMVLSIEVAANQKGSKQKLTGGNWSRTSRSAVRQRSATHQVVYRGVLGSITARIQSQSEDSVEGEHSKDFYVRDEWSWVLIPSFLSRCVQVQCASFLGSIERTLRTCPILPDDHPAWQMCQYGELTSIQALFSTREISPYAIDRYGRTLLHVATGWYCPEVCNLLLEMGVGAEVVDAAGHPAEGLLVFDKTCDEIESTYRLFTAAHDNRDLVSFCQQYFGSLRYLSVEDFRSRVENWVTEENVNLFNPSALEIVTRRLCNLSIDPIEFHKWKDVAFYLIAKKAKFLEFESLDRETWDFKNTCLLQVAATSMMHPFDAQTIGARLLEMLDASNVDLAEYLTFERQHHPEGLLAPNIKFYITQESWCVLSDPRPIKLYIGEEQPFSLSWDWWVDPNEPACTVLHEFRHFGRAEAFLYEECRLPGELLYWPFTYPKWTFGPFPWTGKEQRELLKSFQQRFNRRWQKKMTKQAKKQGTHRKPRMPGTWID